MGNQKQKWTAEEEDALNRGVQKHGPGKWKNILKDPEFAPFLTSRSNIDLKDKWRNLSVGGSGQGSKDKSRTSKNKTLAIAAAPLASAPAPVATLQNATPTPQADDSSKNSHAGKTLPGYSAMIFEALSAIKDANGSDINAIISFIEQKHKVPQNFRRALGSRLRRLASQGKLEKIQNCYKIKKDAQAGAKSHAPIQNDAWSRQSLASGVMPSRENLKDAAEIAAYKVADAEHKSFLAAEAIKEVEKLSRLAEENDSMLQLAKDIYEKCLRAEVVVLAQIDQK